MLYFLKFDFTITVETIATITYCILTAFILVVGYRQLKSINKTNNAQFLQNMNLSIFAEETIKLITLIHSDSLIFDLNNNNPIFKVDFIKIKKLYPNRNWEVREYYTSYEIDFMLLNDLDLVGSLVETKVVTLKRAHQDFAWYIYVTLNNKAILEYLDWIENYEKTGFVFCRLKVLNQKFERMNASFFRIDGD